MPTAAPLSLSYRDRYRLWVDLVRGRTDRLFIATSVRYGLGSTVLVAVDIVDEAFPIEVRGTVVGWRPQSEKFRQGIFIRLHEEELEKCRLFLKLERLSDLQQHARRNYRVKRSVPVRMVEPAVASFCACKNISETGILLAGDAVLRPGQRVVLELHFDSGPLQVDAEVIWAVPEQDLAGLRFVDLLGQTEAQLGAHLENMIEEQIKACSFDDRLVVVVDTDDEVMTLALTALNRPGVEIVQCTSGAEAISCIRARRPGLVLMDVLVPEIDGAEICEVMRADAELAHIPVILMSPLDADTLRRIAVQCGANDYLIKPFKIKELTGLVSTYFHV